MTAQANAGPKQIQAPIRYVVKGEATIFYPAEREKSYWPADDHIMTITDMRPLRHEISVEKNGFALLTHNTAVRNFFDPEEVKTVFMPEVIELALRINGAARAIAFGPVARSDDPTIKQGRLPSFGAHVDYGRRTIEEQCREIMGKEEAQYWLQKRVVLMNFWRPINKPVYRSPLALCDASTVLASDLNDSEIRGGLDDPSRPPLWGFNLSYNPDHRWYYVHHMQPDEILAFKLYDSDSSQPQWTGHTAINDPESSENDPPRESMEVRTISFIEE
ncbi:MAG: CmcJ/NvfI family oxidoreductase [Pseudomonadales bacterium]|nr:CmcJ/NvfI family oxidoreductase [Pseudomonadales bacterium]